MARPKILHFFGAAFAHGEARTYSPGLRGSIVGRDDRACTKTARSTGGTIKEVIRGSGSIQTIAVVGNHVPRRCGIATFTSDLSDAIAAEFPALECFVVAMNDGAKRHAYPERVRYEIADGDLAAYRSAARFLNASSVDVVSVQHEFGIFGGDAGGHLLALLRDLEMPIVTTLHTILAEPDPYQRAVMDELTHLSQRLVVMSTNGADLLRRVHRVPEHKIDRIPHGIPSVPHVPRSASKPMILTFGLLSPDKGIEHVIDALPEILQAYPDAVYVVLGATHPQIKERHGETYRSMLETRARQLGVESSVVFHDRFVSQAELVEFLSAAEIYITPYLNEAQITSGTLAYAVGSGKAVISTPYQYARELLAEGRGILVPRKDPIAIATEVVGLLGDDVKRRTLQERAAAHGRGMTWPIVARSYVASFERSRIHRAPRGAKHHVELPDLNLDHLRLMTDDTGLLQHATFGVPRYEDGYCLDDNARALLLTALLEEAGSAPSATRALASRYVAFVSHAFNRDRGRFRNFMSYGRSWLEACGSEDSHGRALWALGTVVARSSDEGRRRLAESLFHAALPAVATFTSPRAWAYALLGIDEHLHAFPADDRALSMRGALAGRLLALYRRASRQDWPWFEDRLTYCNARLAQALIVTGERTNDQAMLATGIRSLEWLVAVQSSDDGHFAPIGSNGHYARGGQKAEFDQQPVEVWATLGACLEARRATRQERWAARARCQFDWFVGLNHLRRAVYDAATGGCRDGLHADRVNENQGAESTLSFIASLVELRLASARVRAVASREALVHEGIA